jgi:hypothetical protein
LRAQAVVLAGILMAGLGTVGLRSLGQADPVTVEDALQRFRNDRTAPASATPDPASPTPAPAATSSAAPRSGSTARPGAGPGTAAPGRGETETAGTPAPRGLGAPPEGVYVYATTGFETGDAGPAHARHDYPAQTSMTVTRDGCGSSWRWEPVENRWDDITDCMTSGTTTKVKVYDTFHEFFGVSERHTYVCSGDSWFRPPVTTAGYAWTFDCASDSAQTHTAARVVGTERVSAGDGMVDALHVHFDTTMTGRTEGTNPSDYWVALDGPYLVRKTGRVDAQVHADVGTMDYHEEYDVRLTSRRPRT